MDTRLLVLGLLARQPMHGYELVRELERSRADEWAAILPGSIYHALKQLTAEGWVELCATERTGHRLKAVYAITAEGERQRKELLRQAWRVSSRPFPVTLYTCVAFFTDLPRAEVNAALDALAAEVALRAASWRDAAATRHAAGHLPAHLRLAFANASRHLEADAALIQALRRLPNKPKRKR
jgi:DNA-binding PadR family transcriptional regulator